MCSMGMCKGINRMTWLIMYTNNLISLLKIPQTQKCRENTGSSLLLGPTTPPPRTASDLGLFVVKKGPPLFHVILRSSGVYSLPEAAVDTPWLTSALWTCCPSSLELWLSLIDSSTSGQGAASFQHCLDKPSALPLSQPGLYINSTSNCCKCNAKPRNQLYSLGELSSWHS